MVILTAALQKSPTEFIMLPNEVFALECRKRYEEQGLIVDKSNGQFAHCPLPRSMGDEGVYLLWGDHQHQGLLQSRDVGRRCYWAPDVKLWLDTFPERFFELYEIYDEFNSGKNHPNYGRTGEKNPLHGRTGALNFHSKAIIAIEPDGTERHYGGIREASRDLGIDESHLCNRYLILNKQPKGGKFEGWQFFYVK